MNKIMKVIILIFVFSFFSIRPGLVLAVDNTTTEIDELNTEIQARKDKIKQLEETIVKYNKNITEKRTEAVSLKNQMSILENRIAQAEVEIDLTDQKLKKTQLEIESLNLSIAEKQATIDKQKKIIAKIVQDLYANDQKNFLEIILTNNNFAEFYNQAKYLEDVYTDLGRSAKSIRLAKEDLDKKKSQTEIRRKMYDDLLVELNNKKIDLNEQVGEKQNLLVTTQSSELRYRTLLASLKQQYAAVEKEVQAYEDQVRKKLAQQGNLNNITDSEGDFSWPVSGRYITAAFHDVDYPFRRVFEHSGIDIRAAHGTPVKATASGYVGRAKRCTLASCYSYVLIIHNGSLSSVYGHLSSILVDEDQYVNRGDLIGYSGGTPGTVGAGPFVTGPHLHFESRLNGIPVNPMNYLQ